ncbi:MAG: hypothetical protein IJ689_00755 [Alphaproteobacteria bacterium]|nr:hypothetical protein [Alphaproteobacteria bacterium]
MIKRDKILFTLILIFSVIITVLFASDIKKYQYDYSAIITFISVIVGFLCTGFSILFNSTFIDSLYHIKDDENKQISLKHRVKNYFLFAFKYSIFSVMVLLLYPKSIDIHGLRLWKQYFVIPIVVSNSVLYLIFINYLSKIFIKNKGKS